MHSNEITLAVIEALERIGLPYMLVGSHSTNLYGVPRSTKDADLVVEFGSRSIGEIIPLLGAGFDLDPQMSFETITGTYRHIIRHRDSAFKVEIFMLSNDAHDRSRFFRRRAGVLAGKEVIVPSPEDVIITKLRWSKSGSRQKDIEDVQSVLAVTTPANLDLAYIRQWCDTHGTRELFEELLSQPTP